MEALREPAGGRGGRSPLAQDPVDELVREAPADDCLADEDLQLALYV
ncbi:MAG: hypothetical protein JO169_00910, partial [Solirubrobacterales bacterium]|nr:hypothetical protein [Solirubrobacterales bacterium]